MGLTLITPPTSEPVSLAEAKEFCRVTDDREDTTIQALISAAVRHLERDLAISISEQQWQLTLGSFYDVIDLPKGPVTSVDLVQYVDAAGDLQDADPSIYTVDLTGQRHRIIRNASAAWPKTNETPAAVMITYTAGMADVDAGRDMWLAIQFLVQHFYDRGADSPEEPPIVKRLTRDYRRFV